MQMKPRAVCCLSQAANRTHRSARFVALHCCLSAEGRGGIDIPHPRTLMMSSGSVSAGWGRAWRPRAGSPGGARRKVHPEDV